MFGEALQSSAGLWHTSSFRSSSIVLTVRSTFCLIAEFRPGSSKRLLLTSKTMNNIAVAGESNEVCKDLRHGQAKNCRLNWGYDNLRWISGEMSSNLLHSRKIVISCFLFPSTLQEESVFALDFNHVFISFLSRGESPSISVAELALMTRRCCILRLRRMRAVEGVFFFKKQLCAKNGRISVALTCRMPISCAFRDTCNCYRFDQSRKI